jgi:Ni,Fe-hydrogenase I cytochrome b subunit
MRNFLVIVSTLMVVTGFITFPRESGQAMAKFISVTQWAVLTVIPQPKVRNSGRAGL